MVVRWKSMTITLLTSKDTLCRTILDLLKIFIHLLHIQFSSSIGHILFSSTAAFRKERVLKPIGEEDPHLVSSAGNLFWELQGVTCDKDYGTRPCTSLLHVKSITSYLSVQNLSTNIIPFILHSII